MDYFSNHIKIPESNILLLTYKVYEWIRANIKFTEPTKQQLLELEKFLINYDHQKDRMPIWVRTINKIGKFLRI
jgi:hypothetical protein